MTDMLHLLRKDSTSLALPVIERAAAASPGADITVVLLDSAPAPALPSGICLRRLGAGDLDYSALLDLIFEVDHVVAW